MFVIEIVGLLLFLMLLFKVMLPHDFVLLLLVLLNLPLLHVLFLLRSKRTL